MTDIYSFCNDASMDKTESIAESTRVSLFGDINSLVTKAIKESDDYPSDMQSAYVDEAGSLCYTDEKTVAKKMTNPLTIV